MIEATETRKPEPVWRCQVKGCTFSRPPTLHGYNQIGGHQLHHSKEGVPKEERVFLMVDQNTNEVLAKTLKEAREKGLLEPPAPGPEPEPEPELKPEPKLEPKAKKEEGEITEPQVSSDGIFKYTIALPSDAFTLFNLAKSSGLEKDSDKPFDEWIWDCITARFRYDYEMQLILAPILKEET